MGLDLKPVGNFLSTMFTVSKDAFTSVGQGIGDVVKGIGSFFSTSFNMVDGFATFIDGTIQATGLPKLLGLVSELKLNPELQSIVESAGTKLGLPAQINESNLFSALKTLSGFEVQDLIGTDENGLVGEKPLDEILDSAGGLIGGMLDVDF